MTEDPNNNSNVNDESTNKKRYIRRRKDQNKLNFDLKNDNKDVLDKDVLDKDETKVKKEVKLEEVMEELYYKKKKNRYVNRYVFALLITLIFLFMFFGPFHEWLKQTVPNKGKRIFIKLLLIFTVMLLIYGICFTLV